MFPKNSPTFFDQKALELNQYLPENKIEKHTSEYFNMASVCRQYTTDQQIISFINMNNDCNVVFLALV